MKFEVNASANNWLITSPFPSQQTYATPLKELPEFVESLLAPFEVDTATVWIERLVFEPKELIWYLRGSGVTTSEGDLNNSLLHAESGLEAATLLECILGQWADFAFLPTPREFALYADHDEFTTVFTKSPEVLRILRRNMRSEGFQEIQNWTWSGLRTREKTEF